MRRTATEKADIAALKAADAALAAHCETERKAGIHEETPEYTRLNQAANTAAARVSTRHGGTRKRG